MIPFLSVMAMACLQAGWAHIMGWRIWGATVIPASTGNTEKHVRLIRDLGITGIACTPSYALYLAEVVERMGLTKNDINLRIGAFGAEPWTESMRKEIEERLGLKGIIFMD